MVVHNPCVGSDQGRDTITADRLPDLIPGLGSSRKGKTVHFKYRLCLTPRWCFHLSQALCRHAEKESSVALDFFLLQQKEI